MTFLALMAALAAAMPGQEANMNYDDVTRVEYIFTDSSVPPQYHRSFAIEATRDSALVVVDSYGEVLARETRAVTPNEFQSLMETLAAAELSIVPEKESEGCTGGTTEAVVLYEGESEVFRGWVYTTAPGRITVHWRAMWRLWHGGYAP